MPCPELLVTGMCEPPDELHSRSYDPIAHQMLDIDGHQSDAAVAVIDLTRNESLLKGVSLGLIQSLGALAGVQGPENRFDTSFTQLMHAIYAKEPDTILATYRSAVPVLSAVRGYYDQRDTPHPHLDYVDVSYQHRHPSYDLRSLHESESQRLMPHVDGAKVAIFDQYVFRGSALTYAAKIVRCAGSVQTMGALGYWYKNLAMDLDEYPPASEIDAVDSDFMYELGRTAATIPRIEDKPAFNHEAVADAYCQLYG